MPDELDLSHESLPEVERHLGHLVRQALVEQGACVLVLRNGSVLTPLPAEKVFSAVSPEALALLLLDAGWEEHEIVNFLTTEEPAR